MVPPHLRRCSSATTNGEYAIECKLARGGMAELFLARVIGQDDELVVLKTMLPQYAREPELVELFLDEARLVAALDHPHIARVHGLGLGDGDCFFAMEYVHGKDVRSVLRRTAHRNQKFPLGPAVEIARDVAGALHHVHECRQPNGALLGIVHRDISPSNIVVSYEGCVKLVDFGIAKAASTSIKTRTGVVKGKIPYMSPEQASGAPIDRRSDVFSLGIVLWEMITTQRLFQADNDLAVISQIVHSTPRPPSSLRPECPPRLDHITLKALASDPDARYQTAEQVERELAEVASRLAARTLRAHMQQVFEPEITAWKEAREAGLTLVDHVATTGADLVMPTSDAPGDLVSVVDDDLDELALSSVALGGDEPDPPSPATRAGTIEVAEAAELAETDSLEPTAYYTPRPRAVSPAIESTPVSSVIRRASSQPVFDVTTYPTITSDPFYATVSREHRPDESKSQPWHLVVVLLLAILAGSALAVMV